jgi:IclR family acetate operon transcriptional repressor
LADYSGGLGLQDLADTLDLPVSTVHRLATVLESEGYLLRTTKGKRFLLGPAVRRLVASTNSDYLRTVAEPFMSRLNRSTGETVYLAELVGHDVICVAHLPGISPLRFFVQLGRSLPLHASAAARVILASLTDPEVNALIDTAELTRWTDRTITDRTQLLKHLGVVRKRHWDICDDEMEHQVWAVAAPLYDVNGELRASIAVVAPLPSINNTDRQESLRAATVAAAAEISAELGGEPRLSDGEQLTRRATQREARH